jgi:hypothetical protein
MPYQYVVCLGDPSPDELFWEAQAEWAREQLAGVERDLASNSRMRMRPKVQLQAQARTLKHMQGTISEIQGALNGT